MKNKLNFLSERDKYNLIVVYPYLYLNTNEKETYDLFRNGEREPFGYWRWEWDNGELLDTNIAEELDGNGLFNSGSRQFRVKCYSIEDVCFLYTYFLKEGFRCKLPSYDIYGLKYTKHLGICGIERKELSKNDIIAISEKYDMPDSFDNEDQRYISVQVNKEDYIKFRLAIIKLEEQHGYSNVWTDGEGLKYMNWAGSGFIIK